MVLTCHKIGDKKKLCIMLEKKVKFVAAMDFEYIFEEKEISGAEIRRLWGK